MSVLAAHVTRSLRLLREEVFVVPARAMILRPIRPAAPTTVSFGFIFCSFVVKKVNSREGDYNRPRLN